MRSRNEVMTIREKGIRAHVRDGLLAWKGVIGWP